MAMFNTFCSDISIKNDKEIYITWTCFFVVHYIRGSFKTFCYERLPLREKEVCFTDFVNLYSVINQHVKFEGIEQISTLLLPFKVISVIYTGLYLRMKRKKALQYGVLISIISHVALKSSYICII